MQMFEIPQRESGRLWIMPCPQRGLVRESAQFYRQSGADYIMSMLTPDEMVDLGCANEKALCQDAGMVFSQYPIEDFSVPEPQHLAAVVNQINGWLADGRGVAVHCRAGIGRSGMVTSCVLAAQGLDAEEAIHKVATARGVAIPDTVEQGSFIATFAQRYCR